MLKLINKNNINEDKLNNISYENNYLNSFKPLNKNEENEIINIRRHLNEFYENKKKISNSNKFNDCSNKEERPIIKDDSIKNDLLKGLLNNNNEQSYAYFNDKSFERSKLNLQKNDINNNFQINNPNINNKTIYSNNNYNEEIIQENFNKNENNSKYNFKQDLFKDINKIPKSSGLNFNINKNMNSFQFQFNNNIKMEDEIEIQKNQKDYINNMNINNNQDNLKIYNHQIDDKNQNKITIEDSININGLVQNSNLINIENKNDINTNSNMKKILDNEENERRKQDLLKMINFSSNLKINNYFNNNMKNNNQNIIQGNFNDNENFNLIYS